MTQQPNTDGEKTPSDHIVEILQRLRENFASAPAEQSTEGLKLLDELEQEWRMGSPKEGRHDDLRTALGHAEQSLHQAANRKSDEDDRFHQTMHALEAAIVELETTLPTAARLVKRMAGLISNIGL